MVPTYVQNVKKNINNAMKSTRVLEIEYNELQKAIKDGKHEYHCFYLATINKKEPKTKVTANIIPPVLFFYINKKVKVNCYLSSKQ